MKQKILLCLLCAFSLTAFSQNNVKVFGYYQENLPGIIPKGTSEDGKSIPERREGVDYKIYLTSPASSRLYLVEMWIMGAQYGAKGELLSKSPVEIPDNLGKPVTLVPKTSAKVVKVTPVASAGGKKFPNAKAKSLSNELVIVYKLNGKFYSATQKTLVRLEPKSNE